MWLMIIIMAISMIGIGVIQLMWFKSSVQQDEKNFDDKVSIALAIVKERLLEDAHKTDIVMRKYREYQKGKTKKRFLFNQINTYKSILNSAKNKKEKTQYNFEISSTEMLINPYAFLERINKNHLASYIKHEIEQQGIDLKYDYGVYSNKSESFIIMNGHFLAQIGSTQNKSHAMTGNALFNSNYQISLFNSPSNIGDNNNKVPGYLKIYFPDKDRWLWSSVMNSLILSLLFTGLVLFAFGYTIYVVQRQKQISEMKTDFINNMTHEFKTPIATISLAADSIGSPKILGSQEKVMRFTNIIKQENKRMLSQVEKVLQMAMLDKKTIQLKLTDIDIHQIITEAVDHASLKIEKRDGQLTKNLNAEKHIIKADRTHISNIVHNLLDNAEKYSPDTLDITIATINNKNGIIIDITDKGLGMSKDQVKNIFEKFYRVHTGNIHNVKGFGLGLSYVKALVEAHNGTISVKSEKSKGSTFSISLPFGL